MIAMGVAAVGMGAVSAISAASKASSANAYSEAEYQHRQNQEIWQYGEAMWGVAQKNATRWLQNDLNARAISRNFAKQQIQLYKNIGDKRRQLSRSEKAIKSTVKSQTTAKLGANSGTATRIVKQMELQGAENWKNEFLNQQNAQRALEQMYENNLKESTDLGYDQLGPYMPGLPPQQANIGMATMMGGLQGAAQGIQMVGGVMGALESYERWKGSQAGGSGGWGPIQIAPNAASSPPTYAWGGMLT